MLVRLGNIWVDPHKIVSLEPLIDRVEITTTENSFCTEGDADKFASIINNVAGQSYGGTEDEAPKEE